MTPTYLTLQSVDSVKQALDPRVMDNAHICQLHYKTAWVHDERPNFYKSIFVVLQMLDKEPPLAQMWVETRWEYLQSINILNGVLSMVPLVWLLYRLQNYLRATHISNVWKDILKISR